MNRYQTESGNRKLPAAKSTFMKIEEIDRERALSGWDPYAGEVEVPGREPEMRQKGMETMQDQRELERDRRRLQSMYPQTAKLLLPVVEEVCDRMEYAGSPMFDETPDRTTIYRLRDQIMKQMQGQNWQGDLIQVMLLDEIHQRRCRHKKCCKQTPCSI